MQNLARVVMRATESFERFEHAFAPKDIESSFWDVVADNYICGSLLRLAACATYEEGHHQRWHYAERKIMWMSPRPWPPAPARHSPDRSFSPSPLAP